MLQQAILPVVKQQIQNFCSVMKHKKHKIQFWGMNNMIKYILSSGLQIASAPGHQMAHQKNESI